MTNVHVTFTIIILFIQPLVNVTHDLKSVWINDMLDDEASGIKYANHSVFLCTAILS